MRSRFSLVSHMLLLLVLLGTSACSSGYSTLVPDSTARPAQNTPDHFLVGTHTDATTTESTPDDGCRNPMVDPRDGTKLTLVRSSADRGDYDVPAGKYGVGERELLRLDCGTGRVIGIVPSRA